MSNHFGSVEYVTIGNPSVSQLGSTNWTLVRVVAVDPCSIRFMSVSAGGVSRHGSHCVDTKRTSSGHLFKRFLPANTTQAPFGQQSKTRIFRRVASGGLGYSPLARALRLDCLAFCDICCLLRLSCDNCDDLIVFIRIYVFILP